nr:hypothetical protein [Nitrososphaeria archaeon]
MIGEKIALIGGKLIDGTGREPLEDAVILLEAPNILNVGKRKDVDIPLDAKT